MVVTESGMETETSCLLERALLPIASTESGIAILRPHNTPWSLAITGLFLKYPVTDEPDMAKQAGSIVGDCSM